MNRERCLRGAAGHPATAARPMSSVLADAQRSG
jgi:hypothetical protein